MTFPAYPLTDRERELAAAALADLRDFVLIPTTEAISDAAWARVMKKEFTTALFEACMDLGEDLMRKVAHDPAASGYMLGFLMGRLTVRPTVEFGK